MFDVDVLCRSYRHINSTCIDVWPSPYF